MKNIFSVVILIAIAIGLLSSCDHKSYDQGYRDGFRDGFEASKTDAPEATAGGSLQEMSPVILIENDIYELSLIDAYQSEEEYHDRWVEESYSEQCYVFKFKFLNKHQSSNIRIALVNASINGYSLIGTSDFHSDDSFSVYAWSGDTPDNAAVDCFKLFFSDIEAATNIRDAEKIGNASLSFVFRAYIIDEMDDYGEDVLITIEDAFQYCQ